MQSVVLYLKLNIEGPFNVTDIIMCSLLYTTINAIAQETLWSSYEKTCFYCIQTTMARASQHSKIAETSIPIKDYFHFYYIFVFYVLQLSRQFI